MGADPIHGRGTSANASGRFEGRARGAVEELQDDWPQEEAPSPRTVFFTDHARSALTRNDSPDVGFEYSVNPYRGCEHGCVYCYARPTHEYLGLSAGLDFESKIFVKDDAPTLLRRELAKKSWQPRLVAMSGVTDCYQPIERQRRLTRGCLEVLAEFGNPVALISKNFLVTRDIDLLASLAAKGAALVCLSLTTLDAQLAATMEPRTSRPTRRLEAIRQLAAAKIPVGVMVAPVIPGLTDVELPQILQAAAEAGASFAGYTPLRLPLSVQEIFAQWLRDHYPEKAEKILHRIRELRGGKLNDPRFNSRMRGEGIFAEQIAQLFRLGLKKAGLSREFPRLSTAAFAVPGGQLGLF